MVLEEAGHPRCYPSEKLEEPRGQAEFLPQLRSGFPVGSYNARAAQSSKATKDVAASGPLGKGTGGERTEQLNTGSAAVQIIENIGVDAFIGPIQFRRRTE